MTLLENKSCYHKIYKPYKYTEIQNYVNTIKHNKVYGIRKYIPI
jgi:hypothetical protein